jgi:DNA-binding CsgD family transcriptional regulator
MHRVSDECRNSDEGRVSSSFQAFCPVLRFQAYSNAQHYRQLQQNLTQFCQSLDCLSLIIINTSGQIQFITSQATQHLQCYFAESNDSLHLPDHLWAWVKHQISSITHNSDLPNACLPLRIEQDGKQLVIRLVIEKDDNQYLLLLEEQTLPLLPSLELLGLSPRETEVLYWVIRGEDNQSIAKRLAIHLSTVRKHLESIFRKLGVQSRTEAIAQALEKLGILNSPPLI